MTILKPLHPFKTPCGISASTYLLSVESYEVIKHSIVSLGIVSALRIEELFQSSIMASQLEYLKDSESFEKYFKVNEDFLYLHLKLLILKKFNEVYELEFVINLNKKLALLRDIENLVTNA